MTGASVAWERPDTRVWVAGWSLAVALHGAVVVACLIPARSQIIPPPPPAPLLIEMVTLPPEPVPQPQPQPVPIEEPPPPPEVIETPPEVKPVVALEAPKPKPKPKRPPKPVVDRKPVEAPPPPPAAVAAPASPAPPRPAPPSQAELDARQLWRAKLMAHLERYKRYPRESRRRHEEGVVMLRFRIAPDGRVLASRIVRGAGHPALNNAVIDMIARANPVPAPPAAIADGPLEWTVPVNFSLRR